MQTGVRIPIRTEPKGYKVTKVITLGVITLWKVSVERLGPSQSCTEYPCNLSEQHKMKKFNIDATKVSSSRLYNVPKCKG